MSTPTTTAELTHDADTGVRGHLELFRAVIVKRFILMLRYPVNTISQYATLYPVFLVMFYGGSAIAPAAISETIDGIIVGYLLWSLSIASYAGLSWNVTREAQ